MLNKESTKIVLFAHFILLFSSGPKTKPYCEHSTNEEKRKNKLLKFMKWLSLVLTHPKRATIYPPSTYMVNGILIFMEFKFSKNSCYMSLL